MNPATPTSDRGSRLSTLRDRFVTADAVYGTIVYAALIASSSDEDDTSLEVLAVSAATLLIFWAAHVFAGTLARHGRRAGEDIPLPAAFRHSLGHSTGTLYAGVLPTIGLLLGVAGVLGYEAAVQVALWTAVVVLGFLGYHSVAERGRHPLLRLAGGLVAAVFGLALILLDAYVH